MIKKLKMKYSSQDDIEINSDRLVSNLEASGYHNKCVMPFKSQNKLEMKIDMKFDMKLSNQDET